jgi:hypothetical protein
MKAVVGETERIFMGDPRERPKRIILVKEV